MSYCDEVRLMVILVLIFNDIYTLLFSFVGLREILDEEMHERCPSG